MGGAIGGLIVICLTILGIVLIRRKHGAKLQATSPTSHANYGRNNFADDAPLHAHELGDSKKKHHWDGSYGPVELYSGRHINTEPVELSGGMGTPRGFK